MQNSMMSKRSSNISNLTSLSASNKKHSSYLQRYRGKKQQRDKHHYNSSSYESTLLEDQLKNRTQKVIELCNRGEDISDIKIEDEKCQSEFMRNEYLQTEMLWFKKIDETKHQVMKVKELCEKESKAIRDAEKEITEKRNKLMQLTEKLQKQIKEFEMVEVETYDQEIEQLQQEQDNIHGRGQELLQHAREERDLLLQEKHKEEAQIEELQRQIKDLCEYEDESYNARLADLLAEQNKLQEEIVEFQDKIAQTQREIRTVQARRPVRQETHRKYLQLYQKMYANKQLDKVEELVQVKHKQIGRLQDCEKKSSLFQLKKTEVQQKERKVEQLQQMLKNVEQEIRQKSTIILELYQHQSQKMR